MYCFKLDWKNYNINLTMVHEWLESNIGSVGMSADYTLNMWFAETPAQETLDSIQAYWDSLTEESEEATSYVSAEDIKASIEALKEGLLAKEWADMSQAERKLVLGMQPTLEELGL